jgi:hypothetical protein
LVLAPFTLAFCMMTKLSKRNLYKPLKNTKKFLLFFTNIL